MIAVSIFVLTSALIIISFSKFPIVTLFNKKIQTFWLFALLGALLMVGTLQINMQTVANSLLAKNNMNPLKLIVLFLSMSLLSLFLDEIGFFHYMALLVLKLTSKSQWLLFTGVYLGVSLLTLFTSNDVIILTLTLFIIYFAKNAKINPLPYLFAQFVAANTVSITLIIGNPTNMYLASTLNLDFIAYFKVMVIPSLMVGLVSFITLAVLFRKDLQTPLDHQEITLPRLNRFSIILGLSHLLMCIVFLVVSNYLSLEMWLITLAFASSLTLFTLIYKPTRNSILASYKRVPWAFIPFLIGMFVVVLGLDAQQITSKIALSLSSLNPIISYGLSSALFGNLMNNIPMSVFYGSIISYAPLTQQLPATFATIIGSNLTALFTPLGSLAGLMWLNLLKQENITLSFKGFVKYGFIIGAVALFVGLLTLALIL